VLGGGRRELYYPFDRQVFKSMFKYQEFMRSSVEVLEQVVRTGLRVLIVGGDCGQFLSTHLPLFIVCTYSHANTFPRFRK
jgi:hypothetical protein